MNVSEVTPRFLPFNYFNLSNNHLSDDLPKVLTQYPKLRVLDISSNQSKCFLLTQFFTMPTLQELHLENNLINGGINLSSSLDQSHLQVLDPSHNQLSSFFPDEFGSLTSLRMLNIAGNNFVCSLPTTIADMSSFDSLDISNNRFTGPHPNDMPKGLKDFNASENDLSRVVPKVLRMFPSSSFFLGNAKLHFPNTPPGSTVSPTESSKGKSVSTVVKVIIIVSCVVALFILILMAAFIHYICLSRCSTSEYDTTMSKDIRDCSHSSQPVTFGYIS